MNEQMTMVEVEYNGVSYIIQEDGEAVYQLNEDDHLCEMYMNIRDGYKRVGSINVARLVATAYIPNPNNLPLVIHVDGNKRNDRKDNLQWADNQTAYKHSFDVGTNQRRQFTAKQIEVMEQMATGRGYKLINNRIIADAINEDYKRVRQYVRRYRNSKRYKQNMQKQFVNLAVQSGYLGNTISISGTPFKKQG